LTIPFEIAPRRRMRTRRPKIEASSELPGETDWNRCKICIRGMKLQGKLIFAREINLLRFCHTLSDSESLCPENHDSRLLQLD
jgi:hypothetical protein